jgi:hypothetical protein
MVSQSQYSGTFELSGYVPIYDHHGEFRMTQVAKYLLDIGSSGFINGYVPRNRQIPYIPRDLGAHRFGLNNTTGLLLSRNL